MQRLRWANHRLWIMGLGTGSTQGVTSIRTGDPIQSQSRSTATVATADPGASCTVDPITPGTAQWRLPTDTLGLAGAGGGAGAPPTERTAESCLRR